MRTKEDADDYRYFPDPDLLPVAVDAALLEEQRGLLPELPGARRARYVGALGLSEYDAGVLTGDRDVADFFEAVARAADPKQAANWVSNEVLRALSDDTVAAATIAELPVLPGELATLIGLVGDGTLSNNGARQVFAHMVARGGDPRALVEALGLAQVTDGARIEAWCRAALDAQPRVADAVRNGNDKALGACLGAVMQASAGRADPALVRAALLALIHGE
jgi:aspartyl-tRNA(Asn)/glutamyl-tRNA(Gln) amidotransferase subunit B